MSEYNPADHKVEDVEAHVEKNPAEAQAVLEAEKARGDDARKTLVASLEKVVEGQHEVPQAAEAAPVEVSPSPTPTLVGGTEFEVTPERGHRRV